MGRERVQECPEFGCVAGAGHIRPMHLGRDGEYFPSSSRRESEREAVPGSEHADEEAITTPIRGPRLWLAT